MQNIYYLSDFFLFCNVPFWVNNHLNYIYFSKTKPSRRINPTPVSTERLQSRPKKCFTSTPLSQPLSSMYSTEATSETFGASSEGFSPTVSASNLQEEREMLKIERYVELHLTTKGKNICYFVLLLIFGLFGLSRGRSPNF